MRAKRCDTCFTTTEPGKGTGLGLSLCREIAEAHGALGWKVNGAGGEGGSLTLLCGESSARKRALVREIEQDSPAFRIIPIYLSRHGLRVWRQDLGA